MMSVKTCADSTSAAIPQALRTSLHTAAVVDKSAGQRRASGRSHGEKGGRAPGARCR